MHSRQHSARAVADRAHHGVDDRRVGGDRLLPGGLALADAPEMTPKAVLEVVFGGEPIDEAADRLRKRLIGGDGR